MNHPDGLDGLIEKEYSQAKGCLDAGTAVSNRSGVRGSSGGGDGGRGDGDRLRSDRRGGPGRLPPLRRTRGFLCGRWRLDLDERKSRGVSASLGQLPRRCGASSRGGCVRRCELQRGHHRRHDAAAGAESVRRPGRRVESAAVRRADPRHRSGDISIGGNDIGLSDILQACMARALGDPGGSPCRNYYTEGGFDRLTASIDAVAPRIAATLDGIRQRAPRADIAVIGYLPILPSDGRSCFPSVPIAAGDAPYLAEVQRRLNGMLADQAAQHGSIFVDTFTSGHDACRPAGFNWSNPLFFPNPFNTWPFHPNIAGQAFIADRITAALPR
ncbi:SGNH/GDSL hydrolase family protein [Nocardia sp. NPDC127526]|uniref:SGNH/GDSL hydrolase family protein n=1 Tax=Nocardia sp. NPDC127526 TaxID=3345393 RepID=UPI00363079AE